MSVRLRRLSNSSAAIRMRVRARGLVLARAPWCPRRGNPDERGLPSQAARAAELPRGLADRPAPALYCAAGHRLASASAFARRGSRDAILLESGESRAATRESLSEICRSGLGEPKH